VLAIDPRPPNMLYAGVNVLANSPQDELNAGVFKSADGGATWSSVYKRGLPADAYIQALAVDPHTSTTLYVGVTFGGVFQSDDGGANWRPLSTGQKFEAVRALVIDPREPTTIYALTTNGIFSIQQATVCAGDCRGVGIAAINDLITLVNIALGTMEPATCAKGGLPLGGEVNIAVIIKAVTNALDGCDDWCNGSP